MAIILDYQIEDAPQDFFPQKQEVESYLICAAEFLQLQEDLELTLRIVQKEEIQTLNREYRHKDYPTNVLSFPADWDIPEEPRLIGDIVVAAEVVNQEATEQNKSAKAHWTHIIIHGFLHLLGYDHIEEQDAEVMEDLERKILQKLGISDPYSVS